MAVNKDGLGIGQQVDFATIVRTESARKQKVSHEQPKSTKSATGRGRKKKVDDVVRPAGEEGSDQEGGS